MKDEKNKKEFYVSINVLEKKYDIVYFPDDFPDFEEYPKALPDKFINEFNDIQNLKYKDFDTFKHRMFDLEHKLYLHDKKHRILK